MVMRIRWDVCAESVSEAPTRCVPCVMLPHKPVRLILCGRYSCMSLSVLFGGSDSVGSCVTQEA